MIVLSEHHVFTEISEAELLYLSLEDDEYTLTCSYEFGLLVTTVIGEN